MGSGDAYRVKAAEINGKAAQEVSSTVRAELRKLAMAYLLLAEQADSNDKTDLVYETPSAALPVRQQDHAQQDQAQQQQQPQQKPPPEKP